MTFFNTFGMYILILVLILILIVMSIVNFTKTKKIHKLEVLNKNVEKLLGGINFNNSLDTNITEMLTIVASLISAPYYGIYIYDNKNDSYLLKTVIQAASGNAQAGPSYSGLLPYKKENFFLPPTLSNNVIPGETGVFKYGEVPLIFSPFENKKILLVIGPASRLSSQEQESLRNICGKMNPIITALMETDDLKNSMKLMLSSENAVKNVSSFFTDIKSMLNVILEVTIKSIGAAGGLFIREDDGKVELETIAGLEENMQNQLSNDPKTQTLFFQLLGSGELVILSKSDKDYYKIPPYFIADEVEKLLITRVKHGKGSVLAVFWYNENIDIKDYQITALNILSKRIVDILNNHANFKKIAASYTEVLISLAKLIDNLSKNTVGYSDLMYRYAFIICKEMKLPMNETKDIALAAYLSNIGVIGLSDKLLTKKGKYSEIEYEMMKLHADAGASIIEATIGNAEIASCIRYHHERIDGYGYPAQLKGSEIPLGARIIAVVQTFLAKILSRDYRAPLPFNEALNQLRKARGTQLDSEAVDVLIKWFENKQSKNRNTNRALGECWEMRCSPENICIKCPAYGKTDINCWENKDVNCAEHGSKCEDCFIYTEYLYRKSLR